MRTTIELTDEQHRSLTALASRRGMRGFSQLVQEAVDQYLQAQQGEDVRALLDLEGSMSDRDAAELRQRIADAWSTWRASS